MDANVVVLTGALRAATPRTVGAGRRLVEVQLDVARPGRRGADPETMGVPITVWRDDLGAALKEITSGTPLTVVGRVSARTWQSPSGGERRFVEIVAESIGVGVTVATEPVASAGAPRATPPAAGRARGADAVPF